MLKSATPTNRLSSQHHKQQELSVQNSRHTRPTSVNNSGKKQADRGGEYYMRESKVTEQSFMKDMSYSSASTIPSPISNNSSLSQSHQDKLLYQSQPQGQGDGSQMFHHRSFGQQQLHNPTGSSGEGLLGSAQMHHQIGSGFNSMYTMGPLGAAGGMVMPPQTNMSPRPNMSSVMILQRNGSSPGHAHSNSGFIGQSFSTQGPGLYQGPK